MLLKDKIKELNTIFQKSYFDEDHGFFSHVIPEMLNNIKSVINDFITRHPSLKDNFEDSLSIIETTFSDLEHLEEVPNPSISVKDNYLIGMKKNISQALWRFHDNVYRFDARLLNEIV